MKKFTYVLVLFFLSMKLVAQPTQYLDRNFTTIEVSYDHVYAENATILFLGDTSVGQAVKEPLHFDLYKPKKDDPTCNGSLRPLIIYFHSGNFLPFPYNLSVVGTRRDSSVVEMCRRIASTGYVVASADYRLGWNPFATPEIYATAGIINAAYRGVQDANTCIRYFKKTVAEDGNPFKIDTNQIVLFGDDTGGYLSIHAGCLDRYEKIPTASKGKFLVPTGIPAPPFIPMIIESVNGDVEGKKYGIMTPEYEGAFPYPVGDTLCYANYIEYSSDFRAAVNLGGAVADTAWMDPGQPPIICVHAPYDRTTPYKEDFVKVGDARIIEVQGSYIVSDMANKLGNNACLTPPFNKNDFQITVNEVADSRNDGIDNLYPIMGDTVTDGTPWVFWDPLTNPNSDEGFKNNPHMTREKAELYMDTILAYVLPRLYKCLDLCITATHNIANNENMNIITFPNPASNEVFIGTDQDHPIKDLVVFNMEGIQVRQYRDVNTRYFDLPVHDLVPGQYVLRIEFEKEIAVRRIIVQ